MTTRSLILSPHEVRAALDGRLGLVVRPVLRPKTVPADYIHDPALISEPGMTWWRNPEFGRVGASQRCPFGVPGDRLRCKEAWALLDGDGVDYGCHDSIAYRVDDESQVDSWRSPATMPAWASRITLDVTGVRCVRVRELCSGKGFESMAKETWDSKYAKRGLGWEINPFVWAVEVRRVEG